MKYVTFLKRCIIIKIVILPMDLQFQCNPMHISRDIFVQIDKIFKMHVQMQSA